MVSASSVSDMWTCGERYEASTWPYSTGRGQKVTANPSPYTQRKRLADLARAVVAHLVLGSERAFDGPAVVQAETQGELVFCARGPGRDT